LFTWAFGPDWADAGLLARALAVYIGLHFIASPLGVVTMAWQAQAWALKLALVGQVVFVAALAGGLAWGGLAGAGWAVSGAMALYFGWYFSRLATWPLEDAGGPSAGPLPSQPAMPSGAEPGHAQSGGLGAPGEGLGRPAQRGPQGRPTYPSDEGQT
jgi:hypothetical protein